MTELARKRQIASKELNTIKRLIRKHYPDSVFRLTEGAERSPRSLWLDVYTDLAEASDITDLINDRRMDLLVRKKFLLSVLPQPLAYLPPLRQNGKARRTTGYPRTRAQAHVARERQSKYQARSKKRGKS